MVYLPIKCTHSSKNKNGILAATGFPWIPKTRLIHQMVLVGPVRYLLPSITSCRVYIKVHPIRPGL